MKKIKKAGKYFFFWRNFQALVISEESLSEVFLGNGVLKICSKFIGEHPCRIAISLKCNFIDIALQCGCSPVNLLHMFRTPSPPKGCFCDFIVTFPEKEVNAKQ